MTGTVLYAAEVTSAAAVVATCPAPPAGKANVRVSGTYKVDAGQTADKIEASFYTKDKNNNLQYVGKVNDPNFAAGNYSTSLMRCDKGTPYTIVTWLYVAGNNMEVASAIVTIIP